MSALRKAGFEVARIKGSHHFLCHSDGATANSNAMNSSRSCSRGGLRDRTAACSRRPSAAADTDRYASGES